MDVNDILKMDPKSDCKIYFTFTEEWGSCYYQPKQKSNSDLDPNKLPLLEEQYMQEEAGEPLCNDKNQYVYDPTQEIKYENYMEVDQIDVYTSKSFIELIQKKIHELIDSGEISSDSDNNELLEALEVYASPEDAVMELFSSVECNDFINVERKNGYDDLLWCLAMQIESEHCSFSLEEIKI